MSRTLLAALAALLVLSFVQHLLTSLASGRPHQDQPTPSLHWTGTESGPAPPHVYPDQGR